MQQPNTVQIKLYVDDFQVINPFGNKTRKHKICAFYWALGNLPSKFRSKQYTIQLLALPQSINIKKFGFEKVLQNALVDIVLLEQHGIEVQDIDGNIIQVYGTVSTLIADNLAAHEIGGYIESFNSFRICRFCNATKAQAQEHFTEEKFQLQTKGLYDSKIKCIQREPSLASTYGVKKTLFLTN